MLRYPLKVVLVPPDMQTSWSEVWDPEPRPMNFTTVTVHSGPPAIYPEPPTATTFDEGVWAWLSR